MRLLEAIIDANHRAVAGDANAGLHPAEYAEALPVVALTCIDPRLNSILPAVLGIRPEHFIWLRNAGNIITGPLSSTMRSLALACAVKGGREIAVIGHSDCQVCKTSMMELTERLKALGVGRGSLPENLTEYFGLFASERQNAIKAAEIVRSSPLIGPQVPVHGLLVDIDSGRLEWLVNGYQALGAVAGVAGMTESRTGGPALGGLKDMLPFNLGEMKFPEGKIGELASKAEGWVGRVGELAGRAEHLAGKAGEFADKIGDLSEKAKEWMADLNTPEGKPKPAARMAKGSPSKPIPGPPPVPPGRRPPQAPRRKG